MPFQMTCLSKESNIYLEALPADSSTAFSNACLRLGFQQLPKTCYFSTPVCDFSEDRFLPNTLGRVPLQSSGCLLLQLEPHGFTLGVGK